MTHWFSLARWAAWSLPIVMLLMSNALIAQPTSAPEENSDSIDGLKTTQQRNAEMFRKFQRELLTLAQRLEKSAKPEDQNRAKVIFAALELSQKQNLDNQFQKLIASMAGGSSNVKDLNVIAGQDEQLQKALQDIMAILMTDDESARIKAEIKTLEEYIKEIKRIERDQKTIRGITDSKRVDPDRIAKEQKNLAERTKETAEKMGGKKDGEGKPGEKEIAKAEPKSEPKDSDETGETKPDTDEKKSESKENADGEPKDGEPKSGEPKSGEPKSSEPKDGMGKPKPGNDDPKEGGEPKASPKDAAEPKAGEPKPGEPKPSDAAKAEAKPSESKSKRRWQRFRQAVRT